MPDESLLDDSADFVSSFDDDDIDDSVQEETFNEAEKQENEKTGKIRAKLSKRKNESQSQDSTPQKKMNKSSGKSKGNIVTPLLIFLLLIVGILVLLQMWQLSSKVTAAMLSMSSLDGTNIESNPSYDYAIDFTLDDDLTERMTARGHDGWQVVGSRRAQDTTTGQYGYELIYMRRIQGR